MMLECALAITQFDNLTGKQPCKLMHNNYHQMRIELIMEKSGRIELVWENFVLKCLKCCSNSIVFLAVMYRKTSSRGAYGHDPFWSVFEEYPLDSTRSDSTYNDIIFNMNSVVVISVVVESSRCSSKTLQKDHVHMRLCTRLFGMLLGSTILTALLHLSLFSSYPNSCSRKCRGSGDIKPG